MLPITDKALCCGCSACVHVCPQGCISLEPDAEGFLYPAVREAQCTHCGRCDAVCPVAHPPNPSEKNTQSYVIRAKERDVLMGSTSGGFFTPLAAWVLGQGGAVCAASFDHDFRVKHVLLRKADGEDYRQCRGSKYVQSDLDGLFPQIRQALRQDETVCFVGTPCQVAGLKAFLGADVEKLITVDLVCHGVPSPKLWDKYIAYQEKMHHSAIRQVSFRDKTYGYGNAALDKKDRKGCNGDKNVLNILMWEEGYLRLKYLNNGDGLLGHRAVLF